MLAIAIRKTPQVRRMLFGLDTVKVVEFRAKRQFIWAFLRGD
jgi:hypothetical protein